jgi:hypothetical protein
MHGSYGDAQEKFSGKKKDTSESQFRRKSKEFKNLRRNRHQEETA